MVKRSKQNIEQHDVESLVNILEKWLALVGQMQVIQDNLSHIPDEIAILRQYSNCELSQAEVNTKIQSVLKSVDVQLPRLLQLEEKVNNSIAQREIIEALEQKINGDRNNDYEISFKKEKLYRDHLKTTYNRQDNTKLQCISKIITQFWHKNYLKISIGVGIATIASYCLFLYFNNQEKPKITLDRTISKVERFY